MKVRLFDGHYLGDGSCPACYSGSHSDCYHPLFEEENACCCQKDKNSTDDSGIIPTGESGERGDDALVRAIKEASAVTDVESTGRKRAAKAYPLEEGMICEWRNLANAGGGVKPIVGCTVGMAKNRHHGPDKNTLNNTEGNVHRICAKCHNRWHTENDEYYGSRPGGTDPFIPLDGNKWHLHDAAEIATPQQIVDNEVFWATRRTKKVDGD